MSRTTKTKNRNWAMPATVISTPLKPKRPATIAMSKNRHCERSEAISRPMVELATSAALLKTAQNASTQTQNTNQVCQNGSIKIKNMPQAIPKIRPATTSRGKWAPTYMRVMPTATAVAYSAIQISPNRAVRDPPMPPEKSESIPAAPGRCNCRSQSSQRSWSPSAPECHV